MKKLFLALLAVFSIALVVAGCGGDSKPAANSGDKKVVLKVGATPVPHAEILNLIKPQLAKEGVDLQIIEFSDYVKPNLSLADKELDANFFQHKPYMDNFNEENGTHLVSVAAVHYEPFGIYPGKTASIEELEDGAKIAIPNDGTNEARALLLLEAQGIYSAYLAAHAASAAAPLIARRDTESLQLVLKLADEENRRQIALACSQSGWSEGAALTLGGQRPRRQKTYDFDDL